MKSIPARLLALTLASSAAVACAQPASAKVALTPPMGWNSWQSYGLTITEEQFRANVRVLADKLKPFGYTYAVIDEGWFFVNPQDRPHPDKLIYTIDANGRYIPVSNGRFPSAVLPPESRAGLETQPVYKLNAELGNATFKPLGDFVHAQGLKFGIHIVRGIPRASVERNLPIANSTFHAADAADTTDACPWDPTNWGVPDTPAGQAWYDSLLTQYAGWGVDLLKVDCISDHPYKAAEIRMIRKAIDKTGRPIVLSLSPGPTQLEHAAEVASLANMWRISDDFWDLWVNAKPFPIALASQFARAAAWAQYAKPGTWPDADMLPLGHLGPEPGEGKDRQSRLTPAEQQTTMTLWSIARSPLILGANLTLLDEPTAKLITNRMLLQLDQTATASREALHSGNVIAWTADLPASFPGGYTHALAVFNTGDSPEVITSSFEAYGLDPATYRLHDVWTGKDLSKQKSIEGISLEPHGSTLYLLRR